MGGGWAFFRRGHLTSKINITFFIANLMLNIFMSNNFFGKSVFSEKTAENCSGEPNWGRPSEIAFGPPYIFYNSLFILCFFNILLKIFQKLFKILLKQFQHVRHIISFHLIDASHISSPSDQFLKKSIILNTSHERRHL